MGRSYLTCITWQEKKSRGGVKLSKDGLACTRYTQPWPEECS